MENVWQDILLCTQDEAYVASPHTHLSHSGNLAADADSSTMRYWHCEPLDRCCQVDIVPQHVMQVAGAAEVTTFAETLAIELDTEMCKVAERRTDIVRLEIGSDPHKISASLTYDLHNFLFESEMYF